MLGGKAEATQIPMRCSSSGGLQSEDSVYDLSGTRHDQSMLQLGYGQPWPKVSVVIPTLNEARNLPHVFPKLPAELHEVIIVDGNSADDTVAVARQLRPDVRIVRQNRSGKGNALACGFAAVTGDIIAMVDADGSADPGEIPQFVKALLRGADFAKGTRFSDGGGSCDMTRLRRLGNRMLSGLVNVLCRTKYSDLCYGYNAFWRRHVPILGLIAESDVTAGSGTRLWGDGFEVETLINIRIAHAGLKVTEVASYEHSRINGVSNLNAVSDGWRVLRTILAERSYHRRRPTAGKHASSRSLSTSASSDVRISQPHALIGPAARPSLVISSPPDPAAGKRLLVRLTRSTNGGRRKAKVRSANDRWLQSGAVSWLTCTNGAYP